MFAAWTMTTTILYHQHIRIFSSSLAVFCFWQELWTAGWVPCQAICTCRREDASQDKGRSWNSKRGRGLKKDWNLALSVPSPVL